MFNKTGLMIATVVAVLAVIAYALIYLNRPVVAPSNIVHADKDLPTGYTFRQFTVEKDLGILCATDEDCETPAEYMAISRCPMHAICENHSCTVVCPGRKDVQ